MNRKARITLTLPILLIALSTGACQQTAERIKGQLAKAKSESEDTSLTPEEQYELGNAYERGGRVPKDPTQAAYWWKKAAEQGHAEAQIDLGDAYYEGEGVPQNHEEALYWYRKAAMQGDRWAQLLLGLAYAEGEGVQDLTQAYAWAIIAQATGGETETFRNTTNFIKSKLTRAQITQGQQRAEELHEQIQANIAERDQAN